VELAAARAAAEVQVTFIFLIMFIIPVAVDTHGIEFTRARCGRLVEPSYH